MDTDRLTQLVEQKLTEGYLRLPVRQGRKLVEYTFRHMLLDEIKDLGPGDRVWVTAGGFAITIKVNGVVKRWKREPDRVEVPVKYGLYDCDRWDTETALARLLVMIDHD